MTTHERIPAGRITWVDVATPHLDRAIEFYGALFGWTVEKGGEEFGGYSGAELGGRSVAGLMPITPEMPMPAVWSTYIAVDDADAAAKEALANGATTVVEPMDVGTNGRMWFGTDPTGAAIGVWQQRDQVGFQVTDEPGATCWHELVTPDKAAADAFYRDAFGWTLEPMDDGSGVEYSLAKHGTVSYAGIMHATDLPAGVPAHWMTYFWVQDTDAAATQVTKAGGSVVAGPYDSPHGRIASILDPWGAAFSIMVPAAGTG